MTDRTNGPAAETAAEKRRTLTPEAERALAEAAERRAAHPTEPRPAEIDGRGGLEPVRYGDWEIRGLTADF